MAALERRLPPALAALTLALACASADQGFDTTRPTQAKREIEQTKQAAEAQTAEAQTAEAQTAEAQTAQAQTAETPTAKARSGDSEPAEPAVDTTRTVSTRPDVVQFETARVEEEEDEAPSLFEAAEAERLRRRQSAPAQIVITDANLADYSQSGRLTELVTEPRFDEEAAPAADPAESDPETYWRKRVRDARLAWRAAADRITELEDRLAELRFEFYSEDDPHHRDAVTKPAWDRAAIDLDQARLRVEEVRLQLAGVLEEGIAAGALPGWLREGLEFEPERTDEERAREGELETATAIEPPIAEEPPR